MTPSVLETPSSTIIAGVIESPGAPENSKKHHPCGGSSLPSLILPGSDLTDDDFKLLQKSWIEKALAQQALLRRVTDAEASKLLNRVKDGKSSGVAFPYTIPGADAPVQYRIRLDHPEIDIQGDRPKERRKYLSPTGGQNRLYFVPGTDPGLLKDSAVPVWIVEGEKKAMSLYRLACYQSTHPAALIVGLSGVWNWKGRQEGETETQPIPDLDLVTWANREVWIFFDANVATNRQVAHARRELTLELRRRGAK
jgi:hypothetical protein